MADLETLISRTIESYKSAVYARDVDAFMRIYDPKVRVFDTWGVWEYENAAQWKSAVDAWLSSLGTEKVKVTFADLNVSGSVDYAVLSAVVTYAGVSADGEELRAMQNRLTWALKTSGHVLRIIHEHTSAPVGFEDMKAILQRKQAT